MIHRNVARFSPFCVVAVRLARPWAQAHAIASQRGVEARLWMLSIGAMRVLQRACAIGGVNTFEGKTAAGRGGEVDFYSAFSKA